MSNPTTKLALALVLSLVVGSTAAALPGQSGALQPGVYARTDPWNTEIIELRDGRFRYWFSSDMKSNVDPHYPLSGRYRFSNGMLLLEHPDILWPRWRFRIFRGVPSLWSRDSLECWASDPKAQDCNVLYQQEYTPKEIWHSDFRKRPKWHK